MYIVVVHTFVDVNLVIISLEVRAFHVLHALEENIYLPAVLHIPIQYVKIASSQPLPHIVVILDVHGLVIRNIINLAVRAMRVEHTALVIHMNQNLAHRLKIAYVRLARNQIMHHGMVSMAVVGLVIRDIINLAVLATHVHQHVQVIHRKRVFVHRHKTVYVHLVRNLPIQSFPRLQDVVGIVNLAITKVAVIVLLALYVQQDNLNQKVAHQHKIVNVL